MLVKIRPLQFEEKMSNPVESILILDSQSLMVNETCQPIDMNSLRTN